MKTNTLYLAIFLTIVLSGFTSVQGQTKDQLNSYVGRYDYQEGRVLIVTLKGDQMYAQLTGQDTIAIFPTSENEFHPKVVEASLKFMTDANGKVTHIIHNQNGMQFEAKKLPDETPVSIDPAVLDKYVGKYNAGSTIVVISKEGNKLFGQGMDLPPYELLPASDTEFFLRELNARITFVVSDDGTVNSINIIYNGEPTSAVRISD
jgi:hypothetical protein